MSPSPLRHIGDGFLEEDLDPAERLEFLRAHGVVVEPAGRRARPVLVQLLHRALAELPGDGLDQGFPQEASPTCRSATATSPDSRRRSITSTSAIAQARASGSATEADLPACLKLINRTHKGADLFRPYTMEFLEIRLNDPCWGPKPPFWNQVYGWKDYYVLEEDGRIVACGGLWDKGENVREVWRHKETGEIEDDRLDGAVDFGYAAGREDAMVRLIEFFTGKTKSWAGPPGGGHRAPAATGEGNVTARARTPRLGRSTGSATTLSRTCGWRTTN